MRRILLGFLVGVGCMYYYLRSGAEVFAHAEDWLHGVTSRRSADAGESPSPLGDHR